MSTEREFLQQIADASASLAARAPSLADTFAKAEPFPHVVVDDLFPATILDRVLDEFPGPKAADWIEYDDPHQRKLATKHASQIGPRTRAFINFLNSAEFIEFVEQVSGIQGLIPDPHLDGGGLHQIPPGGKLGIHTDFLMQARLKLDRRLNLILYLNRDWKEEWGGHLEFWPDAKSGAAKRVLPLFNRMVIFATTSYSFHGHPEPLTCPPDRFRRSIALYYYSNGRPAEERSAVRHTRFVLRPGERARWTLRQFLRRLVPPIINDLRYIGKK